MLILLPFLGLHVPVLVHQSTLFGTSLGTRFGTCTQNEIAQNGYLMMYQNGTSHFGYMYPKWDSPGHDRVQENKVSLTVSFAMLAVFTSTKCSNRRGWSGNSSMMAFDMNTYSTGERFTTWRTSLSQAVAKRARTLLGRCNTDLRLGIAHGLLYDRFWFIL